MLTSNPLKALLELLFGSARSRARAPAMPWRRFWKASVPAVSCSSSQSSYVVVAGARQRCASESCFQVGADTSRCCCCQRVVRGLLVLLGQVVLDDNRESCLRRDLRDVDLEVRLIFLLRYLVAYVVSPSALLGEDGHCCSPKYLEMRSVRNRRHGVRHNWLASDPNEIKRVFELRRMKLLREEVARSLLSRG